MIKKIDIASEFTPRLVYRDKHQGESEFNAIKFRDKFLQALEEEEWWENDSMYVELDFSGVKTLGPSWANEIFAYYTSKYKPKIILQKIRLVNITEVKKAIIKLEIETGYSGK